MLLFELLVPFFSQKYYSTMLDDLGSPLGRRRTSEPVSIFGPAAAAATAPFKYDRII